jgi:hypothetical protein
MPRVRERKHREFWNLILQKKNESMVDSPKIFSGTFGPLLSLSTQEEDEMPDEGTAHK